MSNLSACISGGRGGIRTHDPLARMPVFKTGAFNRSATLPNDVSADVDGARLYTGETFAACLQALSFVSGHLPIAHRQTCLFDHMQSLQALLGSLPQVGSVEWIGLRPSRRVTPVTVRE